MHNNGVCHRDLKPNNILCSTDGSLNIKITDFNVSKFVANFKDISTNAENFSKIKMWTYTGTISFSAPEILKENNEYDEKIDIWSAGVILYTMLCG